MCMRAENLLLGDPPYVCFREDEFVIVRLSSIWLSTCKQQTKKQNKVYDQWIRLMMAELLTRTKSALKEKSPLCKVTPSEVRRTSVYGFEAEMSPLSTGSWQNVHIDKQCRADSPVHTYTLAQTSHTSIAISLLLPITTTFPLKALHNK